MRAEGVGPEQAHQHPGRVEHTHFLELWKDQAALDAHAKL
jgi:quinol monooxygenase YgiN